jgi:hypothetical protein
MAKRNAGRQRKGSAGGRKSRPAARSAKRSGAKTKAVRKSARRAAGKAAGRKKASPARASRRAVTARKTTKPFSSPPRAGQAARTKAPRLDRVRRTLEETVPTPPSSLNMDRRGSAARTGRAELAESLADHKAMAGISGGDVDVDLEQAYFSGDEAPGGDNPTPDQDVVDDIGKALGVEYQDNEELKAVDKVAQRDRKRWELDPASSEDYKDRK